MNEKAIKQSILKDYLVYMNIKDEISIEILTNKYEGLSSILIKENKFNYKFENNYKFLNLYYIYKVLICFCNNTLDDSLLVNFNDITIESFNRLVSHKEQNNLVLISSCTSFDKLCDYVSNLAVINFMLYGKPLKEKVGLR